MSTGISEPVDYAKAFDEGAQSVQNVLDRQRQNAAYNAYAKQYGPMAGNPQLGSQIAEAQTNMLAAPQIQAANQAKAAALQQSLQQFGPSAGNPEAQQQNLANQDTQGQAQRYALARGLTMLKGAADPTTGAIDPKHIDAVVGTNAQALGFTPEQYQAFRTQLSTPGGATNLDQNIQGLLAPQPIVGARPIVYGKDGQAYQIQTGKDGNTAMVPLGDVAQASVANANNDRPIKQQNANANSTKAAAAVQNAATGAYRADTTSNNSAYGNPNGQLNVPASAIAPSATGAAPALAGKPLATRTSMAQSVMNANTNTATASQIINQLDKQASAYNTGAGSWADYLRGSSAANLHANASALRGQVGSAIIASMKNAQGQMGFRMTNAEFKTLTDSLGALGTEQSATQFKQHLGYVKNAITNFNNTMNAGFKTQFNTDPASALGMNQGPPQGWTIKVKP